MAEEEPAEVLSEPLLDLSDLGRTVDGSGLAFLAAECIGKRIGPIKAIEGYAHLQRIDFSENLIKDVAPLKVLNHLVKLSLAKNSIVSLKSWDSEEAVFPNLKELDLSENQLPTLGPLPFQALVALRLARNEITSCELGGHEKLQTLDLSSNKLTSLAGLGALPSLKLLNASGNELADLNGINEATALEELQLAENKLQALEAPWTELQALTALDVSACALETEKPLEVLRQLPLLRKLKVKGNPFTESVSSVPVVALVCHWRLTDVDDIAITEEHTEAAKALNIQRILEERERLKEEAAKAEAEG
ncbi:unnamed protein product [Effrenium voratum]|uniref:Uncharacterized protein n=1 Tax=Effrenium voratum TaxID=2562239 RepID=A0AA36N4C6_9DINO|nr:unnamed protein product [Effrenium voratum]